MQKDPAYPLKKILIDAGQNSPHTEPFESNRLFSPGQSLPIPWTTVNRPIESYTTWGAVYMRTNENEPEEEQKSYIHSPRKKR